MKSKPQQQKRINKDRGEQKMSVRKALNTSTNVGKKQTYYMEVKGRPGRIYIRYLEFGSQLQVDGRASLRPLDSPLTIYPFPGFRGDPLFNFLSAYHQRAEIESNGSAGGGSDYAAIPECVIGVETKENGRVSLDIIYRLKHVKVIYQNPTAQIPRMMFSFFNSEKVWRTWD